VSALKTTVTFLPSWHAETERARHLPLYTETKSNSELSTWLACQVRHHYSYGLRRKPRVTSDALSFGTLWHEGMAAWWGAAGDDRLLAGLAAFAGASPFVLETLTRLLIGYTARWGEAGYTAVAIEQEFTTALVNPDTGETHPTIGLLGILDKVVTDTAGTPHVMEHKTSSADISTGASYWDRVRTLDAQVSGYIDGARSLGFDVPDVIYDVVAKPTIKPLKATPEEKRKYTKPTKANPEPRLYANQRIEDETPEAYGERLSKDIAENPHEYFARGTIVRLEADELRHRRDTWEMVRQMRAIERPVHNRFACDQFSGCSYREVCEGRADIMDEMKFVTKEPRSAR
jgi:hypothetical protein